MPTLIDNLNLINSYKSDIKSAIENKGVDMTGVSFGSYADKIGEIPTSTPFVTETLRVSSNGVYYPSSGVDGFSLVDVSVNAPDGDGTWSRPYGLMDAISVINDNPTGTSSMYVRAFVTQINSAYSQTGTYGNAYFYVGPINSYNYNWLSAYRLLYFDGKNYNSYPDYASRPDIQIGDEVIMYGAFRIYNNKPQTIQGQTYLYALNGIYGVEPNSLFARELNQNGPYDATYDGTVIVNVPPTVPVTESLSVSVNGTYAPGQGVDGFSQVVVDVPQSVTGYDMKDICMTSYLMTEPSIYDSSITVIDMGRLTGCRYRNGQLYYMSGLVTSIFDFPNCSMVLNYGFASNSKITSVNLPTCTYLGSQVFADCINLSYVNIPSVTTLYGRSHFAYCNSLSNISLPNVDEVTEYCFYECESLSTISLPKCETIGMACFQKCYSLSTVYLSICKKINANAFNNCSSLEEIWIYTSSVCSITNINVFGNTNSTFSVYVPASLVDAYKSANNWSTYSSQIFSIPE